MINAVDLSAVVDTIFALSALKKIDKDPTLPGPFGRHEEPALHAIAVLKFAEICEELGVTPINDCSVDLDADCHKLLQCILTDRTIEVVSSRSSRPELMRKLKCRLRKLPPKDAKRY